MALGQFCCVFHNLLQEAGAEDKTACMFILVFFIRQAGRVSRFDAREPSSRLIRAPLMRTRERTTLSSCHSNPPELRLL